MAKVFIEETTLTAIGDAIRGKTGKTELIDPANMSTEIASIEAGGGGGDNEPPESALQLTSNMASYDAYGVWDWFVLKYGHRMSTSNIYSIQDAFNESRLTEIPFVINLQPGDQIQSWAGHYFSKAFNNNVLKVCPKIRGDIAWQCSGTSFSSIIYSSDYLTDVEDLFTPEMMKGFATSAAKAKLPDFGYCEALRRVPTWWHELRLNETLTTFPSSYTCCLYYATFPGCYVLDEIKNVPVWKCQAASTSNMFSTFIPNCSRLASFTFETNEDGTPKEAMWKTQTIEVHSNVGWSSSAYTITKTISYDKEVKDDATYQALKNDPDWFTCNVAYSRYNHDSAVETINSLPDTSAYLATAGGTNTIKFKGAAGSATDGGAINTLTEEEIAIATAKGWTVTFG